MKKEKKNILKYYRFIILNQNFQESRLENEVIPNSTDCLTVLAKCSHILLLQAASRTGPPISFQPQKANV